MLFIHFIIIVVFVFYSFFDSFGNKATSTPDLKPQKQRDIGGTVG